MAVPTTAGTPAATAAEIIERHRDGRHNSRYPIAATVETLVHGSPQVAREAVTLLDVEAARSDLDDELRRRLRTIRTRVVDYLSRLAALELLGGGKATPQELVDAYHQVFQVRKYSFSSPVYPAVPVDDAGPEALAVIDAQPAEVKRSLLRHLLPPAAVTGTDELRDPITAIVARQLVPRLMSAGHRGGWLAGSMVMTWAAAHWDAVGTGAAEIFQDLSANSDLPPLVVAAWRRAGALQEPGERRLPMPAKPLLPPLNAGEAWTDCANRDVEGLAGPERQAWYALLSHAASAATATPSAKWLSLGRRLLADVGSDEFARRLVAWLPLVWRPRTVPLRRWPHGEAVESELDPYNFVALRGLLWLLGCCPATDTAAGTVAALVEATLRQVSRCETLATAGVDTLSRMDGEAAVGQLARLAGRLKHKGARNRVENSLAARAQALGLSRDEIAEWTVPTYGLTTVGGRTEKLGEVTAHVRIAGDAATLRWLTVAGKAVKSPPASVKRDHGGELAELKAAVRDIGKMLAAQRERMDRMILDRRSWRYGQWRERYLDHPLTGTLARRLIWVVDGAACCWRDSALRDHTDATRHPADDTTVELWHPIGQDVDEVTAWRAWLERQAITQPFKQAHREVYLLTDAERATAVYSNRFAARIVRQHQFHQLAKARGWDDQLRLMVCSDGGAHPSRTLGAWGIRAEFRVEEIREDHGTDTTESGSYLRLATGQVLFYPADAGRHADPLPLEGIPPVVFSEVMRDVDLFVGVAGVGNDQSGPPQRAPTAARTGRGR